MGKALHTPGPGGTGLVTAAEARLNDAGLLAVGGSGAVSARTGVLIAPGATAVVSGTSATGTMTYAVAVHHWVTNRGTVADGVYRGAAETAQTVNTTAAPGSGSRTDVIWVKQNDQTSTLTPDGDSNVVYGCTQGAVGGGKPSIPVGAEELATAVVPAGTTRTDTGVTITQTARLTNLRGGPVPIRTAAELAGLPTYPTAQALELDTGRLRWHDGTRWRYSGDQVTVANATERGNLTLYAGLVAWETSTRTEYYYTGSAWLVIGAGPLASYRRVGAGAIASATFTTVTMDTIDLQTGGFTYGTGAAVIPAPGVYLVRAQTTIVAATGGRVFSIITKNGTRIRGRGQANANIAELGADITALVSCAANDQIGSQVYQDGGSTVNTSDSAYATTGLDLSYVRPL